MKWTHFWDMHSGGSQKLQWHDIFIEAPIEEAKVIFYNRTGRNPERVTCTCCGPDYSIDESVSLKQATGFHRGCRSLETPRDSETGLYKNNDPTIVNNLYLERDEDPPEGYKLSKFSPNREYQTLDEYCNREDVLVILAEEIEDDERVGEVPPEGYVWVGDD